MSMAQGVNGMGMVASAAHLEVDDRQRNQQTMKLSLYPTRPNAYPNSNSHPHPNPNHNHNPNSQPRPRTANSNTRPPPSPTASFRGQRLPLPQQPSRQHSQSLQTGSQESLYPLTNYPGIQPPRPATATPYEQEHGHSAPTSRRPSTSQSYYQSNHELQPRSVTPSPQSHHPPPVNYPRPGSQERLHKRPSEASRLRALNNGYRSHSSEGRRTPDTMVVENFSRPRQPSVRSRNESPRPMLQASSTFPVREHAQENDQNHLYSSSLRDRGLSSSSAQSVASNLPAFQLRPSASIPDYQTPDSVYSRQRNLNNNSSYRPGRVVSRADSNYSAHRRDPMVHSRTDDSEEVRASFRSALTTNSSYMASGTERSSIMTKSSSTSIFERPEGREEGMSVDDAIGMYEGGFQDSGTDDAVSRRGTSRDSEGNRTRMLEEAMNDQLALPTQPLVRDSMAMFRASTIDDAGSSIPEEKVGKPADTLEVKVPEQSSQPVSRPTTRAAPTTWDDTRDRYGFRKNTQHVPVAQFEAWNGPYTEHLVRRRKKWVALMKDSGLPSENPQVFPPKFDKVKRFVRKGIPPDWRGAAWFFYAGGPAMLQKHQGVYDDLMQKAANGGVSETDDEIIERDLNRTFPDNIRFKPDPLPGEDTLAPAVSETPILQSLRRVLQAFAIYNPKIGYCQSLNFLAGLLLLFMEEEKSFWMLNIITRVYLPGTHELNLEGANVDLGVLMISVKDMMPAIWAKIGGELDGTAGDGRVSMRLPPITLCTTAWFMSCFIGTLPIETTLRVWDSFFYEGSKTLFRIALTIFKVGEQEIRAVSDPMEIFQVVQTIPRKLVDANALLTACFKRRNGFGHLSQETIEKGRALRRQGYADERAKAAGLVAGDGSLGRKKTLLGRKKGRSEATTDS
ncbi:hypothetical protein HYALB_00012123 [Hymenoscyphus albidus]|uniref:Rab-GAP TBC domain-containing protein n=1 Tax=Hymenoscyphus albidus TaxID=595503 RepID=A0A9N9QAR0_9HELO|nr:hypothetical protein HYALB_00012123 [Hymenoscyphus albidus]